jgi:sec-independent protein translocase protein TatB
MFDIGWTELLLIGVVALIVVGPKDLPHLFHSLGRFTAKARGMAREFTSAMEDAAKGSGLDEASNSIRDLKSLTSKKSLGLDALDRAAERFEKWDPKIPDADRKCGGTGLGAPVGW